MSENFVRKVLNTSDANNEIDNVRELDLIEVHDFKEDPSGEGSTGSLHGTVWTSIDNTAVEVLTGNSTQNAGGEAGVLTYKNLASQGDETVGLLAGVDLYDKNPTGEGIIKLSDISNGGALQTARMEVTLFLGLQSTTPPPIDTIIKFSINGTFSNLINTKNYIMNTTTATDFLSALYNLVKTSIGGQDQPWTNGPISPTYANVSGVRMIHCTYDDLTGTITNASYFGIIPTSDYGLIILNTSGGNPGIITFTTLFSLGLSDSFVNNKAYNITIVSDDNTVIG